MQIVEWECILECNYACRYCTNGHNGVLSVPIRYEKDKSRVFAFLDMIKQQYPDNELFLFGGEPFVHPFIDEIIGHLNTIEQPYIIQTNCSIAKRILAVAQDHRFQIQVSVHPEEIRNKQEYLQGLAELQHLIRRVDVMYIGKPSLEYYKDILPLMHDKRLLFLAPVADFNYEKGTSNTHLFEFNKLKQSVHGKVYQFEQGERSMVWEQQMTGTLSFKGKPCMYKDKYILFDPSLRSFNCNYRQNNEICPNNHCFLM